MQKRRLIYTAIKRPFLKIFLTFTCSIKDTLHCLEYWPKTRITVCPTLVPGPFRFPRHGKGPGNQVDSVLFGSANSKAIYFFVYCQMRSLILNLSVGRKRKNAKKKKGNGEEVSN